MLYFETVRTLGWLMLGMFALGLPSLILVLAANPAALSDSAHATGNPLGALRSVNGSSYLWASRGVESRCGLSEFYSVWVVA